MLHSLLNLMGLNSVGLDFKKINRSHVSDCLTSWVKYLNTRAFSFYYIKSKFYFWKVCVCVSTYWLSTWVSWSCLVSEWRVLILILFKKTRLSIWDLCLLPLHFSLVVCKELSNPALFFRQIKRHCAEPFTEYWTCVDFTGTQKLRNCRKQQAKFDDCVLDKLGWVRPDLGELSKVKRLLLGVSVKRGLCEYR